MCPRDARRDAVNASRYIPALLSNPRKEKRHMKKILWSALLVCLAAGPALADKVSKEEMGEFKGLMDRYGTAWSTMNPANNHHCRIRGSSPRVASRAVVPASAPPTSSKRRTMSSASSSATTNRFEVAAANKTRA